MTTTAHLTLEEFTSSASALPTILVPRSHAARLVELCELSEMMPSAGFSDFIGISGGGGGDESTAAASSSNNGSGGNANNNSHVLVTQMALLMYLGEYTHARHLWRRHRNTAAAPRENGKTDTSNNDDYIQLELLWNAARYCYLWSTGGIHSLTSSGGSNSFSAPELSESSGSNGMQVEDEAGDESSSNLPFSTLALRALQSCASSKMEPLCTYSSELVGVFRSRVNRALHRSFDRIDCKEFCLRMNLGGKEEEEAWRAFGWKVEEDGYLVSDVDVISDISEDCIVAEETMGRKEEERIGKLTDIVLFLEGKMNA